jgi:hypothetical protein
MVVLHIIAVKGIYFGSERVSRPRWTVYPLGHWKRLYGKMSVLFSLLVLIDFGISNNNGRVVSVVSKFD